MGAVEVVGAGSGARAEGVLLVTGRAALVEEVGRLAAAAAVPVLVVPDAGDAGRAWLEAGLVLLGDDAAALGVPVRRSGVLLLAPAPADDRVWRRAVEVGATGVVELPGGESALLEELSAAAEPLRRGRRTGRVVGVVGGSGGAGASVLAVALARQAARERAVLLVDADPQGGGLDLLLGAEAEPGLRWPDLAGARGTVRASLLREVLPVVDGVSVLSWTQEGAGASGGPLPAAAVEAVLDAGTRSHDLVVVDLPRRDDPATLAALWRLDLLVLLVPGEVRAVAAARGLAKGLVRHAGDVRVVLARRPRAALDADVVADLLELPLLAQMEPEPGLPAALHRGEPPGSLPRGALRRCSAAVLAALEEPALEEPALDGAVLGDAVLGGAVLGGAVRAR